MREASALGRNERRSRRRGPAALLRWALGVALSLAIVFVAGFLAFATHVGRMQTPQDPGNADAIIVLTGGVARLDAAVDLLRNGRGERLLISGVNPVARPLDLQRATGVQADLFECCIDIDKAALDTVGNAAESAKWLSGNAYSSAIVVTNNYHMPRSLLELRQTLHDVRLTPYPVVTNRLDGGKWLASRDALRVLFTEYAKYVGALVRTALTPSDGTPRHATVVEADSSVRALVERH